MKIIKKALRLFGLVLIMIIASVGIGISGALLPPTREKYRNPEIRIEQVDKKEDEGDESEEKN
ncbi:MAG: hypothetical protein RIA63_12295 [Cyclobacteriaceae bacterium]